MTISGVLFASTVALRLGVVEWGVIALYGAMMVGLGLYFSRAATKSADGFLIGERSLPWWVIGFANVATYSDSGGGWVWLFYVGGFMYLNQIAWIAWPIWMPLVGIFWAKMWRRSGLVTTGELIELRYSGRGASAFRGFYGVYACIGWATVFLGYGTAMLAQILAPMIGWSPLAVVLVFGAVTLTYTLMGGLLGAAYIDVPQFAIFFFAAVIVWYFGVQEFGSYSAMLDKAMVQRDASFWQIFSPSSGTNTYVDPATLGALVLIGFFLAGSPCAGEGWTAQRCLAAKDERHAVFGQMFNCVLSLVVRMVPLLPLGILAIAIYPPAERTHGLMSMPDGTTAPSIGVWSQLVVRYADKLPGFGGLLIAAVLAGYMSTVGTLLQWGSSFVVNDLYRRHMRPDAPEHEHIRVARIVMVAMMVFSTVLALGIKDIGPWVFFINAAMIAPALPLSWLRWFWWRLNVWGEVFGILVSVPLSALVWFGLDWKSRPAWQPTLLLLGIGMAGSVLISLLTPAESRETLRRFYLKVRPPGAWGPIRRELEAEGLIDPARQRRELVWDLRAAACGILFCFTITWTLFTAIMLRWTEAALYSLVGLASGWAYYACWIRSHRESSELADDKGFVAVPVGAVTEAGVNP
ncbi:sodium:solute symporter family transporter [Singulisphaera acidiphila]|uniref:Na+/proline symporter n=1 Tax=Singulisphaera acidiphila (strain ATCC BAA-1392 / DSM 18658 / VKM B-2454 / MOB10) TaxID=886293 RepID=L0DQY6_SINAD|nr:sodium:solute symporter [Singulisphaera acidiphila]AGA31410.1 Na+/proline symporter [Singulisphaera acidiphila DSM 18658]